jgi:hypothetical protein
MTDETRTTKRHETARTARATQRRGEEGGTTGARETGDLTGATSTHAGAGGVMENTAAPAQLSRGEKVEVEEGMKSADPLIPLPLLTLPLS